MLRPADIEVRDVMSTRVVTLAAGTSVSDASAQLIEDELRAAPVVGDDGVLLGIVSTTDLLRALLEGTPRSAPVGDLVQPLATCAPELDLTEACRLMIRRRVHGLVVVDQGTHVGVFSAIDTARALACLGGTGLAWDPVTQTVQKVEE